MIEQVYAFLTEHVFECIAGTSALALGVVVRSYGRHLETQTRKSSRHPGDR
ncbi:MAG: hypothetical protein ACRYG4_19740 [Janthinobacterium lividum]